MVPRDFNILKKNLMSEFNPCSLSPQSSDSVVTTRYLQGDSDVGGGVAGTARQKRPLERCCGHGGCWVHGELLGPWRDAGTMGRRGDAGAMEGCWVYGGMLGSWGNAKSTEGCWGHVGRMLDHEGMLQPQSMES